MPSSQRAKHLAVGELLDLVQLACLDNVEQVDSAGNMSIAATGKEAVWDGALAGLGHLGFPIHSSSACMVGSCHKSGAMPGAMATR